MDIAGRGSRGRSIAGPKSHPVDPRFVDWARTERDAMDDGFADRFVEALGERISELPVDGRGGWRSAWVSAYGMKANCQWNTETPSAIRVQMILMESFHPDQPSGLRQLAAREIAGQELIDAINRAAAICGPGLEAAGVAGRMAELKAALSAAFGIPEDYSLAGSVRGRRLTLHA